MGALVVGVLVLYFGFPNGNSVHVSNNGKDNSKAYEEPLVPVAESTSDEQEIMYRPFCIHHAVSGDASTARLIQTSMKDPGQQWSILPCYRESDKTNIWKSLRKETNDQQPVETFGAPDAILRVNFSQHAFPQRETPILGFGGAFTEAAALNFHSLDHQGQEAVLELLFGKSGLGYSKGRVHINSCDFSIKSYSFDDVEDDFDLKHFDMGVSHDVESGMIDMALKAVSKLREAWSSEDGMDGVLRLYASPWSPPSWMKSSRWRIGWR